MSENCKDLLRLPRATLTNAAAILLIMNGVDRSDSALTSPERVSFDSLIEGIISPWNSKGLIEL